MSNVCILGSTGSIGRSTLDVIACHKHYNVFALVANSNHDLMIEQCQQFKPRFVVMQNPDASKRVKKTLASLNLPCCVIDSARAAEEVASHPDVDIVMSAIVGAAGLLPTLAAVEQGKRILLANKESLVMSGELFINKVKQHNATLLPIDSEHNAIFQAMPSHVQGASFDAELHQQGVSKILLTGSGGPFLNRDLTTFCDISVEQAVAHPNWSMGQKISVDSATMMNKGLEFIEAKWLFNANVDDIEVVIHPQSVIHSMVQYVDGSVLAQMGNPDMRTPIAHALAFPERIESGVAPLNFSDMLDFTFVKPDYQRYPNLKLAIDACREGQYATTTVNAANEVSVAAFLSGRIGFNDIYKVNEQTLMAMPNRQLESLDEILALDSRAREIANELVRKWEQ